MPARSPRTNRRAGFSLIEVLLAVTISMILLYAAIFSASEAMAVVNEGDAQMVTHVQARRAMDRILKDVRYASQVQVSGSAQAGWTLDILTTGSLSAGWIAYAWDPQTGRITVGDGAGTQWVLEDVRDFTLESDVQQVNGTPTVVSVQMTWVVGEDTGGLADAAGLDEERVTELSGSARLRIHEQ